MIVIVIILGLCGLGLVVLVHELGHFAAARAAGVEVEAFSIGWGPKLFGWKKGRTEWRISAFPLGGFCKMKGEEAMAEAMENKLETIPREPGTFYGAPAWKRILISFSGPLANVIFALVVFIAVAAIGYTEKTYGNRIALASEYRLAGEAAKPAGFPADLAGLRTGDRVVEANSRPVRDYSDLQEAISLSADKDLSLVVERDGARLPILVRPAMDKDTGAGRIGIYSWIEPEVESVAALSAAAIAGIAPGDRIVAVDGVPVSHGIEVLARLSDRPEKVRMSVERKGATLELPLILAYTDQGPNLGIAFKTQNHVVKSASLGAAFADGAKETWSTFRLSIESLGLLFRGVNILKAVSGPARITYMVGTTATQSVAQNGAGGIVIAFNFLAFLSIALFIMNLLPIPSLDGGMIVMFVIEAIRRKPLKTKTIYRYQVIGMAFILGLFLLACLSDILFFSGK